MISERTKTRLAYGEPVTGHFWLPDLESETVPGVLWWSPEGGAVLEPIGGTQGWPQVGEPTSTMWALTDKDDARLTLLDARVTRTQAFNGRTVVRVQSSTLLLGEHTDAAKKWSKAYYATANLTEWRADSGLEFSRPNPTKRPQHLRVDWQPPSQDHVSLSDGDLLFGGNAVAPWTRGPDFTITTSQTMAVEPSSPLAMSELLRLFGVPLLALTAFAADRSDDITYEAYVDKEAEERVEVWRQGRTVMQPHEWDPGRACLFSASDLRNYAASLTTWWDLHRSVWPALDLFADHLSYGNSYSPARLLTLHTALEGYARARHGHKNFRLLRDFAGVPNSVTGCTNDALSLLGVSRKYFAHIGHTGQKYTLADVQRGGFPSTRRASALMQSCLLRELGFGTSEIEELLARHYANWPLP